MHHDDRHFRQLVNRTGQLATRLAYLLGRKIILSSGMALKGIIIKTMPVWLPILVLMFIAWFSYLNVYAIPKSIFTSETSTPHEKVSAFYGFIDDEEFITLNLDMLEKYEEIAERWKEDLTEEQIVQVEVHALSWALLASIDRMIHDPLYKKDKRLLTNPEKVFEDIRPVFEWFDYVEYHRIESCNCWIETDEEGNGYEICEVEVEEKDVPRVLIEKAYTIEGEFTYHYEEVTEEIKSQSKCGELTTTIIKMEVVDVDVPQGDEYYKPLYIYLNKHQIYNELDIQLVIELSLLYDQDYYINRSSIDNFGDYQRIIGNQENWMWVTVSTRVTSHFGQRWGRLHAGIDIGPIRRGVDGDPIWAMEDGVVAYAGWASGYGNVVYINHGDGLQTRYAHLEKIYVRDGDTVNQGDLIGTMGNTGRSSNTHLHFEIRINGQPKNPAHFFDL